MGKHGSLFHVMDTLCLCILLSSEVVLASILKVGKVSPGFEGSQMNWIDRDGKFLVSNKGDFGFGFVTTANDTTLFLLAVVHMDSTKVVWVANRALPVSNSDKFVFDEKGNVFLQKGGTVVWSTDTSGKGVSSMELQDTGNLVLLGKDNRVIWQSFSHPTDTLLPMQDFTEGMELISEPGSNNLTYVLKIESGNVILYAGFQTPQPYWSLQKDSRIIVNNNGDVVASATLSANSWRFYDKNKSLLWQFIFAEDSAANANATWIAVLGSDGIITFSNLQSARSIVASPTRIPQDSCSTPEPCDPYNICTGDKKCSCPSVLSSSPNCKPGFLSPCNSKNSIELLKADDRLNYFALEFLPPSSKTDLIGCKTSCSENCSCLAMFFQSSSGNCFLLDRIGSFEKSDNDYGFVSYIKVSSDGGAGTGIGKSGSSNIQTIVVVIIVIITLLVISGMLFVGHRYFRKKQNLPESPPQENSEEDNFLENLTGMPIRFSYNDLETATNNFSVKLGHGGFGSVYKGVLPDGTQLAVKKLEGIGQGKKEFRAEVSIIGSIHHNHLVRLKGFCAEGTHRLLAYEYMANGSLDRWIFNKNKGEFLLDWDTRFNIALGTAKGLAYLHQDCDSKIVHCDIKPENVLLDDNFSAKVSDFGLAKLMTREQSHVFTTLRGTRGYLAPEWITNYAISEKSDVYSYGMVLLEIIGGRKNYDPTKSSEKSHFPTFAFKMMEEGKVKDILDSKLKTYENGVDVRVHIAVKVALWCIQEDMSLRPSMTKVVQMLEGLCTVPKPPTCSPMASRLYSTLFKPTSEGGTSSGPSDCTSDAYLSAVQLSGPR
ncbi:G-type lectin S-receptor-like serine/threonine-protein kinase SD2-5 [Gastrolobium bilobum]|uniref:G-type lectin S-receptor-like serine/threonine-protein kinase SD2-5 n=1 Tax=Gastrolobium bilobum TaxID=150636 RepID=UPI002AB040E6|nr:G-type lectin S-receptor-like serine/threonine-protein kinase SD2-5 [Gastrolobium bilobum]